MKVSTLSVWLVVLLLSHFYTVSLFAAVALDRVEFLTTWIIVDSITGIVYSWLALLLYVLGMERIMDNCGWGLLYMCYFGFGFLFLIVLASWGYTYVFVDELAKGSIIWTLAVHHEVIYWLLGLGLVIFMCVGLVCESCCAPREEIKINLKTLA